MFKALPVVVVLFAAWRVWRRQRAASTRGDVRRARVLGIATRLVVFVAFLVAIVMVTLP